MLLFLSITTRPSQSGPEVAIVDIDVLSVGFWSVAMCKLYPPVTGSVNSRYNVKRCTTQRWKSEWSANVRGVAAMWEIGMVQILFEVLGHVTERQRNVSRECCEIWRRAFHTERRRVYHFSKWKSMFSSVLLIQTLLYFFDNPMIRRNFGWSNHGTSIVFSSFSIMFSVLKLFNLNLDFGVCDHIWTQRSKMRQQFYCRDSIILRFRNFSENFGK